MEKLSKIKEKNVLSLTLLNKFCDALCFLNVPKKNYSNSLALIMSPATVITPSSSKTLSPKLKNQISVNLDNKSNIDKKLFVERRGRKRINTVIDNADNKLIEFNDNELTKNLESVNSSALMKNLTKFVNFIKNIVYFCIWFILESKF